MEKLTKVYTITKIIFIVSICCFLFYRGWYYNQETKGIKNQLKYEISEKETWRKAFYYLLLISMEEYNNQNKYRQKAFPKERDILPIVFINDINNIIGNQEFL